MARRMDLDILKGYGMLNVVLVHMHFADATLNRYAAALLPAFFVVTGILYKSGRTPKELFLRRLPVLMVPYFVFGILYLAVATITALPDTAILIKGLKTLLIFPTRGPVGESTLWFLPVMLLSSVMYCALDNVCKTEKSLTVASLAVGLVAIVFCYVTRLEVPWGIAHSMTFVMFLHLGVLLERHSVLERIEATIQSHRVIGTIIMIVVPIVVVVVLLNFNGTVNMRKMLWGIVPVTFSCSVAGCVWMLLAARWFDRLHGFRYLKSWLIGIGVTSVVYMCTNHPSINAGYALMDLVPAGVPVLTLEPVRLVLVFIIAVMIMSVLAVLITRTKLIVVLGIKPSSMAKAPKHSK